MSHTLRLNWIDYLRVMATLMVVIVHVCTRPLSHYGTIDDGQWMAAIALRHISTIGVPLFFMISGYLYLSQESLTVWAFLKRKALVILVPFAAWSYIWLIYMNGWSALSDVQTLISPLFKPAQYHLWFMYPFIGLYLVAPLIVRLHSAMTLTEKRYVLWLWFGLCGLMSYQSYIISYIGTSLFNVPSLFISIWVGYFMAGKLTCEWHIRPRTLIYIIALLLITMMIGSNIASHRFGLVFVGLFDVYKAHVMVLACCVFCLFYQVKERLKPNYFIQFISDKSFFIYFIHPIFIIYAENVVFPDISHLPIYYIPALIATTFIGSLIAAAMAHHVLRLKWLLG